jgi:hypothetical protein
MRREMGLRDRPALLLLAMAMQTIWLGNGWRDSWIAAGCWGVLLVVFIEVRSRLIRGDRES